MAIPKVASKLVPFASNFLDKLTQNPGFYQLDVGDLPPLTSATNAFLSAQAAVANPESRSGALVFARDTAQEAYYEVARPMYAAIQTSNNITNEHKADAGVRVKASPSPIPVPAEAPEIDVLSVTGRLVKARIHGSTIEHRAKPFGCAGAYVWSFAGENSPEDLNDWSFWGTTTKTVFEVEYSASVEPGTKVWVCAAWINTKGQLGPVCDPISTYTQFGGVTLQVSNASKKAA